MSVSGDTGAGDTNDRTWRLWGGVAVAVLLAVAVILGIVVIPIVQGQAGGIDPWTAICRAIGISPGSPARPTPSSESPPYPVSRVSWTAATFGELYGAQRKDGEALAQERCIACHTVEGNSADPTIPRNAGQSRFAIYKQLHDYKSGARVSDIMTPLVADLSDKQIADLAAFYGALVRGAIDPERAFPPYVGIEIENLVTKGDVARGLAPCISCHGIGAGGPIETPTITGQYAQYLEAQLAAFANAQRHNDIYHRMRSIASRLNPDEMKRLAIYYSGQ
jgi:cytochrome c553